MPRLSIVLALFIFAFIGRPAASCPREAELDGSGYLQIRYGSERESFEIEDVRVSLKGKADSTNLLIELKLNQADMLIKAQLGWWFSPLAQITLGQQSNPYKYYYPGPEFNPTIYTPYARFIPAANDIGVSLKGRLKPVGYHLCLFNGTGCSRTDDNAHKDLVVRIEFLPWEFLNAAGCWQGGMEETGWREARAFNVIWRPLPVLEVSGAYLQRVDMEEDGWFGMLVYRLCTLEMVSRISIGAESEGTLGANLYVDERLKLQFNCIIPDEGDLQLVARCQLSVE